MRYFKKVISEKYSNIFQLPSFTGMTNRGGEISKLYTCPRTTGCKKALVRTKTLLARTQIISYKGIICQHNVLMNAL